MACQEWEDGSYTLRMLHTEKFHLNAKKLSLSAVGTSYLVWVIPQQYDQNEIMQKRNAKLVYCYCNSFKQLFIRIVNY